MTVPATAAQSLVAAYLAARYRVGAAPDEFALTPGERRPGPWPAAGHRHALLTAANPASQRLADARNAQRLQALAAELSTLDLSATPALASSPDGDWLEAGWFVRDIRDSDLDRLARDYRQNACVSVDPDGQVRLRLYVASWRHAMAPDARLAWAP